MYAYFFKKRIINLFMYHVEKISLGYAVVFIKKKKRRLLGTITA